MTENKEIQLINSNILVKKFASKCWKRKTNYALSVQNLSESFITATKKIAAHIKPEEMKQNIKDIITFSN